MGVDKPADSKDLTGEFTGEFFSAPTTTAVTRVGGKQQGEVSAGRKPGVAPFWQVSADPKATTAYSGVSAGLLSAALKGIRDRVVRDGLEPLPLEVFGRLVGLSLEERQALAPHFESSTELLVCLLQHIYAPVFQDLTSVLSNQSTVKVLECTLTHYQARIRMDLTFYRRFTDLWMNPQLAARSPEKVRLQLSAIDRRGFGLFAAVIAEGQLRGELRTGDPETLARTITSCIYGTLITIDNQSRFVRSGIYPDDLMRETVRIIIGGLVA